MPTYTYHFTQYLHSGAVLSANIIAKDHLEAFTQWCKLPSIQYLDISDSKQLILTVTPNS
jgi:hypothetical protein